MRTSELDIEALLGEAVGAVPEATTDDLVERFRHADDRRDLKLHVVVGMSVIALLAVVSAAAGQLRNDDTATLAVNRGDAAGVSSAPLPPRALVDDDVEVFFHPDATKEEIDAVDRQLDGEPLVGSSWYIDQGSLYVEYVTQFADQPQMREGLRPTDLPSLFRIDLREESCAAVAVIEALGGMPGVREVVNRIPIAC